MNLTNKSSKSMNGQDIILLDIAEFNPIIEAMVIGSDFFIPKDQRKGFDLEYETDINNQKRTIVLS